MDTRTLAAAFTELLRAGQFEEAGRRFWHDDVSSIEAMGEPLAVHGRKALEDKAAWWNSQHEVHGFEIRGPFVNDDQFALGLVIDVTVKATGERQRMEEVALYTVQDGKVVEERFYY